MESGFSFRTARDAAMKQTPVIALGLFLALLTTSCGSAAMHNPSPVRPVDVKDNQPARPQIRRNPNPTAYEITMTIENAPGPFGIVKAAMQYEVLDESSLPDLGGMAGTKASLLEWVPVELSHVSGNTYRGVVYDNLLVDEDYYGLGVCHWSLVTTQFKLQAGVVQGESRFSHHIFHEDLVSKDKIRSYFWNGRYPKGKLEDIPVSGEEDILKFKPEVRDELFVLAFDIRKVTP
jgi:hypothetical protein